MLCCTCQIIGSDEQWKGEGEHAEPHKQESKHDDTPPDQESKHEAVEGKEVQTHNGANNSPEIIVIGADSDGGATKPESSSESEAGNVYNQW